MPKNPGIFLNRANNCEPQLGQKPFSQEKTIAGMNALSDDLRRSFTITIPGKHGINIH